MHSHNRKDKSINLLVVTGNQIIRRKLESKLSPVLALDRVKKVFLVTSGEYDHEKVQSFYPKGGLGARALFSQIYKIWMILLLLFTQRPHVVMTVGLIPHGVYALVLGALFKRKTIFLSMGMNELIYSDQAGLAKLLRKVAFLSDFIGTRGTHSKDQLVRAGYHSEKIFIPNNVFDFNQFNPKSCKKEFDLVYVGVLEPYKSVDVLLRTVYKLVNEQAMADIRMAIVGRGSLRRKLQQDCHELGLEENITFVRPGDADHVCRILNQSKVFVMTSRHEGLPMAVVEALSCGLPVVAFDHADMGDVAEHNKNSLLCPVGDVRCLVRAIVQLLTNGTQYSALAGNALRIRQAKKEDYSLEFSSRKWRRVLCSKLPKPDSTHRDDAI